MAVLTKVIPWFSTVKLLVKSSTERLNNRNNKYNLLCDDAFNNNNTYAQATCITIPSKHPNSKRGNKMFRQSSTQLEEGDTDVVFRRLSCVGYFLKRLIAVSGRVSTEC